MDLKCTDSNKDSNFKLLYKKCRIGITIFTTYSDYEEDQKHYKIMYTASNVNFNCVEHKFAIQTITGSEY
jgi:hypothetical protein